MEFKYFIENLELNLKHMVNKSPFLIIVSVDVNATSPDHRPGTRRW